MNATTPAAAIRESIVGSDTVTYFADAILEIGYSDRPQRRGRIRLVLFADDPPVETFQVHFTPGRDDAEAVQALCRWANNPELPGLTWDWVTVIGEHLARFQVGLGRDEEAKADPQPSTIDPQPAWPVLAVVDGLLILLWLLWVL